MGDPITHVPDTSTNRERLQERLATAPHVRGPLGDHATQTHRAHLEHLAAVRDLLNLGGAR